MADDGRYSSLACQLVAPSEGLGTLALSPSDVLIHALLPYLPGRQPDCRLSVSWFVAAHSPFALSIDDELHVLGAADGAVRAAVRLQDVVDRAYLTDPSDD